MAVGPRWRAAALARGWHERAGPPLTRARGLAAEEPAPGDRYHAIYFAMLLAGVGFLLPYNSFITDVDYLHHKFPGASPRTRPPAPAAARYPPRGPDLAPGSPSPSRPGSAVSC